MCFNFVIHLLKRCFFILIILTTITNCNKRKANNSVKASHFITENELVTIKLTNGFDYPVGKPNGKAYYNAQKFGSHGHLGDDWNGIGGGNSDLGDPIFSIANGYVSFAKNINGGWGNVIRIIHFISEDNQVESLYAHCDTILVKKGDYIKKGQQIATIGTNNGMYLAHLHFELRHKIGLPIGGGYSSSTNGYLNPTEFIIKHRKPN